MLLAGLLVTVLGGCQGAGSASTAPLAVSAAVYEQAFDAALAATRARGLDPIVRDRRAGVIETTPAATPTALEPWDGRAPSPFGQERRHVYLAFVIDDQPVETGPLDLAGAIAAPPDLVADPRPTRLEIRVALERMNVTGRRRSTWSRRLTTTSVIVPPEGEDAISGRGWTAVGRDLAFEAELRSEIEQAIR